MFSVIYCIVEKRFFPFSPCLPTGVTCFFFDKWRNFGSLSILDFTVTFVIGWLLSIKSLNVILNAAQSSPFNTFSFRNTLTVVGERTLGAYSLPELPSLLHLGHFMCFAINNPNSFETIVSGFCFLRWQEQF